MSAHVLTFVDVEFNKLGHPASAEEGISRRW